MNRSLSDEENRARAKLEKLRVGALYASDRMSALRVCAQIFLNRLKSGKADGAIWFVSSREKAILSETLSAILGEDSKFVRISTFQALSHNTDEFFSLLRLSRSMRMMLLIDDGLYIKNVNAIRTHRLWTISEGCRYRLLIAGAPFERNQEDMFSQWYALDARILGYASYWGFCVNHIRKGRLINGDYLSRAIAPYSACIIKSGDTKSQRREYVWQFRLPDTAYQEYRRVAARFDRRALYTKAGVYRMLNACHMVASGRRIMRDYPLRTESLYKQPSDDPRLNALLEILSKIPHGKTLIVCRFHFEMETVARALSEKYGAHRVHTTGAGIPGARYYVESLYLEKRMLSNQAFETVVYYSQNWSLRKRREKENSLSSKNRTTIINIIAADTIDAQMVKRVWKKERSIEKIFDLLTTRREASADAQEIQG